MLVKHFRDEEEKKWEREREREGGEEHAGKHLKRDGAGRWLRKLLQ